MSCRQDEFGNCSTSESEGYCLFHKPEKSRKETRMFFDELLGQNSVRIESNKKGQKYLVFESSVDWRGYVFPDSNEQSGLRGNTFQNVRFNGDVNLQKSIFEGATDFSYAHFARSVNFQRAIFKDRVRFSCAKFADVSVFSHAVFEDEASFQNTVFCDAVFNFADFEGPADFQNGQCHGDISFAGAVFERTCVFSGRTFSRELDFTRAAFYQGVQMERDRRQPEKDKYQYPPAKREGCRVQKMSLEAEGKMKAADMMYAREMRALRKAKIHDVSCFDDIWTHLSVWLETVFVDWTSAYATNWCRLVGVALLLILAFAVIYFVSAPFPGGDIYYIHPTYEPVRDFGRLFYFSA